jgi:ABC-type multidrug transport system fused ATPase/permease subunit
MMNSLDAVARVFDVIDQNQSRSQSQSQEAASTVSESEALLGPPQIPLLPLLPAPGVWAYGTDREDREIRLEGVCFAYGSRPDVAVLQDLSVVIQPRCLTCFVGESGCGKSTLVGLLGGLLHPQRGSISVGDAVVVEAEDSIDIMGLGVSVGVGVGAASSHVRRRAGARWLRRYVGVVQQHDQSLFSGSIRENIEYGYAGDSAGSDTPTQAQVEAAANSGTWEPGTCI